MTPTNSVDGSLKLIQLEVRNLKDFPKILCGPLIYDRSHDSCCSSTIIMHIRAFTSNSTLRFSPGQVSRSISSFGGK